MHILLNAPASNIFFLFQVSPHEGLEIDENEYRAYDIELDEYHPKATRTLFIGGLDKDVTAAELRKHFETFGEIIVSTFFSFPNIAFHNFFPICRGIKTNFSL